MIMQDVQVPWQGVLAAVRFLNDLIPAIDRLDELEYSDTQSEQNLRMYFHVRGGGAGERLAATRRHWCRSIEQAVGRATVDSWARGIPQWDDNHALLAAEYAQEDQHWWAARRGSPLGADPDRTNLLDQLRTALHNSGHLAAYALDHAGAGSVTRLDPNDPITDLAKLAPATTGRWYVETPLRSRTPTLEIIGCSSDLLATLTTPQLHGNLEEFLHSSRPDAIMSELTTGDPDHIHDEWDNRDYALVMVEPTEGPVVDLINPLYGLNDNTLRITAIATLNDHPVLWTRELPTSSPQGVSSTS